MFRKLLRKTPQKPFRNHCGFVLKAYSNKTTVHLNVGLFKVVILIFSWWKGNWLITCDCVRFTARPPTSRARTWRTPQLCCSPPAWCCGTCSWTRRRTRSSRRVWTRSRRASTGRATLVARPNVPSSLTRSAAKSHEPVRF